jgi:hypothetical protein
MDESSADKLVELSRTTDFDYSDFAAVVAADFAIAAAVVECMLAAVAIAVVNCLA